jgi:23S rRNA (cytidine1920-2'-O)/16S rRNA (cytidine1409-2'-O)-methyltransferase
MTSLKTRIDQLLVTKGLVDSRETAQRLILAGKVLVGNQPIQKASQLVNPDANISVVEGLKYASRGGYKLEKALTEFDVVVRDKTILDVGASTGGFTDCLMQNGAQKVYAVDVGYGQLAWKLSQDPRVKVIDRTNARTLSAGMFADPIDLAVIDVSFISSHLILEALQGITREAVLLLKPQFEAGKEDVPKEGVIRDPALHRKILLNFFRKLQGWNILNLTESPIEGGSGNREFLVHLKSDSNGWDEKTYKSRVEELVH